LLRRTISILKRRKMKSTTWMLAVLLISLTMAIGAIPACAAQTQDTQQVVLVRLTNRETAETVWEETFIAGLLESHTLKVPQPVLRLMLRAFGTTTFSAGTYEASLGANQLTVRVSGEGSVTFVGRPWSAPLPASDVRLGMKVSGDVPKGAGGGKRTGAATGVLGKSASGNKYAIVIGIADYPGTSMDLQYSDDDAVDVVAALTTLYGYKMTNIYLLTNADATRSGVMNAIAAVGAKAASGDEVLFFYSGHGATGNAGDGDTEPIDQSIVVWSDDMTFTSIWDGELKLGFADYRTNRIVFAFDSCYAGGMTDLKAKGRIVAMATTETAFAYEWDALQNGEFTYYFTDQGMLLNLADKYDHDKNPATHDVTVEEAFDYAKAGCGMEAPTISDSFVNDLLL
jgi:hypothetical protein